MAAAFLDPHISDETKQELAQLTEARRWPVEYRDPKAKLIWLYRPGMPPMLESPWLWNAETQKRKVPSEWTAAHRSPAVSTN
jgi:hypothetical protein